MIDAPDTPNTPAPADPASEGAAEGNAPRIVIDFPAFDIWAERKQAGNTVLRGPGDRSRDMAEIRDLQFLANYAAHVAAVAVSAYNSGTYPLYSERMRALAATVPWMITAAFEEYERVRRARVWYRRLWRWVTSLASASGSVPEVPEAPSRIETVAPPPPPAPVEGT